MTTFDRVLFVVCTAVIVLIVAVYVGNVLSQYENYTTGIKFALQSHDHAAALTYSRAWDFVAFKTSAALASFLIIMVGALYVLRVERLQSS